MSVAGFSLLVADYMRADITKRAGHIRVGSFLVGLSPHTASLGYNYATPLVDARPSPSDIAELVSVFVAHDRTPRIEAVAGAGPEAEAALIAAGFIMEQRLATLACGVDEVIALATPDGIAIRLVSADNDLLDAVDIQNEAYGESAPAGPHDVDRLQAMIGRGGMVALAREASTGRPCGAGLVTDPQAGVAEVAAIATHSAYRRRGIASSLAALLTRSAHKRGTELVFLDVVGPAEEAVYLRAGYTRFGERVWYTLR
jgi:GNAT superfamily N-acetyltransferase